MNVKYMTYFFGLCLTLIGCRSDGPPTVNSINCSPPGMERILPDFTSEVERQAFIDACKKFNADG